MLIFGRYPWVFLALQGPINLLVGIFKVFIWFINESLNEILKVWNYDRISLPDVKTKCVFHQSEKY